MEYRSRAKTPPIIRLEHPQAFAALLERAGAPSERLMRRVGLPVYCHDPAAFVPLLDAWSFFQAAADYADPAYGWFVGRHSGYRSLREGLLQKLETAPTLYQALKRLVRMVNAEASHLELRIMERRDDILLYTQYSNLKRARGYHVSQAYQMEVYLEMIRHFLGPDWVPPAIGLEHPSAPRLAEKDFPDCRISVGQPFGYIAVPRELLSAAAVATGTDEAAPIPLTSEFDYIETLEALLRARLSEGYPSADLAASLMGTSPRTLTRILSASQLTYGWLIDRLRYDTARELLLATEDPVIDVAMAVGFKDPSNFARMFRRIAGCSPTAFRELDSIAATPRKRHE